MDYAEAQQALIDELRTMGIDNTTVLNAIATVPRHLFVPLNLQSEAYLNIALPIDDQQTISQPYVVAKMTEALLKNHPKKVLEIGTGSGYQAAVLEACGLEVYSIERIKHLYEQAKQRLQSLNIAVNLKYGDGFAGWPRHSPYDAVIVTAAVDVLPKELIAELKEHGQMMIPLKTSSYSQELVLVTKKGDHFTIETMDTVLFVPMKHGTQ